MTQRISNRDISDKEIYVMDPSIFRIDEIKGIYPDQLDEEAAWKIGLATAKFLRSLLRGYERGQANAQTLCVSRDMRTHSAPLLRAMVEGMNASGANVIDIGMIDTPQMYFAINHLGTCGGVQVTASHNGPEYNGFKISGLGAGEDSLVGMVTICPAASCIRLRVGLSVVQCANCRGNV